MCFQMDLTDKGYKMFFRPWQIATLKSIWAENNPISSREIHQNVNSNANIRISRASIINFLNNCIEKSIIEYEIKVGKGGEHKLYKLKYNEPEFKQYLINIILTKLLDSWPTETKSTINTLE